MKLKDFAKMLDEAEYPLFIRTKSDEIHLLVGITIQSIDDFFLVVTPSVSLEFVTEELNGGIGSYNPTAMNYLEYLNLISSDVYRIGNLEAVVA